MRKYRVIERGDGNFMVQWRYWHTLWQDVAYFEELDRALMCMERLRKEDKERHIRRKLQKKIVRIYE